MPPQNPVDPTIVDVSALGIKLPYPMRPLLRALPAIARAKRRAVEQRVCLKRILPTFADDADLVEMFLREARMSALLHHGHIARVLDFGIAKATSLPGSIQSGAPNGKVPYIN